MIYQPEPPVSAKSSNLVTLLLVGGLLIVTAVVVAPMFLHPHRGSALRTQKVSRAKQILLAVQMYASDFDDRLPLDTSTGRAIQAAVTPYAKNTLIFDTLNSKSPEWLGNGGLGGKELSRIVDPFRTVLIFESAPSMREGQKELYRTVGYMNWSARPVTESTFQEALKNGFRTP